MQVLLREYAREYANNPVSNGEEGPGDNRGSLGCKAFDVRPRECMLCISRIFFVVVFCGGGDGDVLSDNNVVFPSQIAKSVKNWKTRDEGAMKALVYIVRITVFESCP